MIMEPMKPAAGFTLVELSIVLVVIGLVIGGIFVGADLIADATMRSQISTFGKWSAALNTYKALYNQVPGDDPNASAYGFGTNGDGNGIIGTGFSSLGESQQAFVHMATAKLVAGNFKVDGNCVTGVSLPVSVMDGSFGFTLFTAFNSGVYTINGNYGYVTGGAVWFRSAGATGTSCHHSGGLTPKALFYLDKKMDDGLPFTGNVRLMGQDGVAFPIDIMCNEITGPGNNCAYTNPVRCATATVGSNAYTNLTSNRSNCPFAVKAP